MLLKDTLTELSRAIRNTEVELTCVTAASAGNIIAYRTTYLYSLLEALARRYPTIEIFIGEANFRYLGKQYIAEYPSQNSNIDLYGENFPVFIRTRKELCDYPYIGDLAAIDDVLYRQDPVFQVLIAKGTMAVWEALQTDNIPKQIAIDPDSYERVNYIVDSDGDDAVLVTPWSG